jgi:c-di-GMP-binding flagellar brake protein YcgR
MERPMTRDGHRDGDDSRAVISGGVGHMGLPSINGLVELIVDEERVYRSRVEDVAEDRLTVAAPMGIGDLERPELGASLDLCWVDERYFNVVQVRLLGLIRNRTVGWEVQVAGEVRHENRRNFVRTKCDGPVTIERAGDVDPTSRAQGRILDVSEGGVRVWVPTSDYRSGDVVKVGMTLDGAAVEAEGDVRRTIEDSRGIKGVDIVVSYELNESDAQVIRRFIIARQIADRRARQYAQ